MVHAEPAALAASAEVLLDHFGATRPTAGAPALALRITAEAPPPLPAGPATAAHLDLRAVRTADALWLLGPASAARLSLDGADGTLWVGSGAPPPLHVVSYVLFNLLRLRRHYALHAACLSRGDAGILLVGPSGSGKSTTTLALLGQGFALVSDDSVLLRSAGGAPEVLALRRGVFLDPAAAAPFPRFAGRWVPCPGVEASKLQLDPSLLSGGQRERCRPALLLLPRIEDRADTALTRLAPAEALFDLASESRLSELDTVGAPDHVAFLAALAGAVPAWRLALGRDVLEAPERVAAAIDARLTGEVP